MSNDPKPLTDAYKRVTDALEFQSGATYEPQVDPAGSDEQIQLQKACRLLAACDYLYEQAFYGSVVEMAFGAMERSLESYMIAVLGSELSDFQNHTAVYERAATHGPISREMAQNLKALYANNRTDYYYDNAVSTEEIAAAMLDLARELHSFIVTHSTTHQFDHYCSCS